MIDVRLVPPFASAPELDETVLELLVQVDEEFVPRLSERSDTTAVHAVPGTEPGLPAYLRAMRGETWLVAERDHRVAGLLSYVHDYQGAHLPACSPCLYATTIVVPPPARGTGLGEVLYDRLERVAVRQGVGWLATRTWTTNLAHLRLLTRRGFLPVAELADDRGPGVSTVYLAKEVTPAGGVGEPWTSLVPDQPS